MDIPDIYVTVFKGVRQWGSCIMSKGSDGEYHIWNTGYFRYTKKEDAIIDAKQLARDEELPLIIT